MERNSQVHPEAWIDLKVWKDLKDYTDYFINFVRPRSRKRLGSAKYDGESIALGSRKKMRFLRVVKDYFFPQWNLDCRTWADMISLGEVSKKKCKVVAADGKTPVDWQRWKHGRAEGMLVHKNPKFTEKAGTFHQWDLSVNSDDTFFDQEIINIFARVEYALFMPSWSPNFEKEHGDWLSDRDKAARDPEEEAPKPNVLIERSSYLNRPMCVGAGAGMDRDTAARKIQFFARKRLVQSFVDEY